MLEAGNNGELPAIPAKRYFTIGEVSEICDVKPHVLRYWEQEFPQLKPVKRRGNRRYYRSPRRDSDPPDPRPALCRGLYHRRGAATSSKVGEAREDPDAEPPDRAPVAPELEELLAVLATR